MRLYLVRFCRSVRCTVYLLYTVSLMGEVRSRFFFVPNSKFVRSYVLVVVVVEREGATSYLAHNWISQNGGNFATDSSLHSSLRQLTTRRGHSDSGAPQLPRHW